MPPSPVIVYLLSHYIQLCRVRAGEGGPVDEGEDCESMP